MTSQTTPLSKSSRRALAALLLALAPLSAFAADTPAATPSPAPSAAATPAPPEPPTTWIDPDTGHRVIRLTREPGSDSFYFNYNAYTPDGKWMAYTTPNGISVVNLETREAKQLVSGPARTITVVHNTPNLYYSVPSADRLHSQLWRVNLYTGKTEKLVDLPRRSSVVAINSNETLGAGTFIEGNRSAGGAYDGTSPYGRMSSTNLGEPANKGAMMARRLAAKLPMTLFTVDLRTGKINPLIQHSTDWLNHLQFSPTDPTLLLYCHEGAWQMVNRIWTIRTDGSQNQLIHKRIMAMEIAGHEWWGADGDTVFYQLHYPEGGRISFIASYNVKTHQRVWLQYSADQSSIHCNSSPDGTLFCGDGDDHDPWINLLRPTFVRDHGTIGNDLVKPGYLDAERLVNMSKQNYRLEPNPSFTPDMKYIVFRSNMFGPDYAFAVEVAKAAP